MNGLLYMDAVITPNRSLTQRGYIILIAILTSINVVSSVVFVRLGAGPIPIFMAMHVIALAVALWASFRAAERKERVQVSAEEVRVLREFRGDSQTLWASPTAFTQVAVEGDPEEDVDLLLRLSGKQIPVATALSRRERLDFAQALRKAIQTARMERG